MSSTDSVSPELRKAEKEIDNYYKSNPLLKQSFTTAVWHLLAFGEEVMLKETSQNLTFQDRERIHDNLVNNLKYPVNWLYRGCKQGGKIPFAFDGHKFQASWNLFKLVQEYISFFTAYFLAYQEWIELDLQGFTIHPAEELFNGIEYEAYNRLIKPYQLQEALSLIDVDNFHLLIDVINNSVKVKGDRFSCKLNPRIVSDMMIVREPILDKIFLLRSEWEFSRYSLGDFRKVFEVISAMADIRWIARKEAINQGCANRGYADSIYVPTCNELLRRVVRYSGVPDEKAQSIFDDLTYGNQGIKHPDPALQPLIKLNSNQYAIMPNLWLSSAAERNLTVLLNKIPSEREIYAKLVDEKEKLMRERFTTDLSDKDFKFISGRVKNLPDVDLAIVNDIEKVCLLLEFKWFIDPAEVREIIEKSEEIEKGISQMLKFKQAFVDNHEPMLTKLGIDSSYKFDGIVVSQNWIGHAHIQSPEVPVIRANHLIEKLKMTNSLQSTMEWLMDKKYLPKEGKHFKIHRFTARIEKWYLKWYGIKPLIKDAFFPL